MGRVVPRGSPRAVGIAIEDKKDECEGLVLTALSFQQCTIGQATEGLEMSLETFKQRLTAIEQRVDSTEEQYRVMKREHEERLDHLEAQDERREAKRVKQSHQIFISYGRGEAAGRAKARTCKPGMGLTVCGGAGVPGHQSCRFPPTL